MIKIVFNKDMNRTIAYDNKKQIGECDFEETNDVWNITHLIALNKMLLI